MLVGPISKERSPNKGSNRSLSASVGEASPVASSYCRAMRGDQGVLKLVSDRSGHYWPDTVFSNQFLNELTAKGVDMAKVVLNFIGR